MCDLTFFCAFGIVTLCSMLKVMKVFSFFFTYFYRQYNYLCEQKKRLTDLRECVRALKERNISKFRDKW